jgi:hypothetical protein
MERIEKQMQFILEIDKERHFKAMGKTLRMMLNMLGIWLL